MSENRCISCGEVIPEGQQCCRRCVSEYMEKERGVKFSAIAKSADGKTSWHSNGTLSEMTAWADEIMRNEKVSEISIKRVG